MIKPLQKVQKHYKSQCNEHLKRWAVIRLKKNYRDSVDVTWRGRAFQVQAAVIGKARSPMVDSRVWRTGSDDVDAGRTCRWDLIREVFELEEFIDL